MRDLGGFVATRQRMLAAKPANRSNWITFAVAQHANRQHDVAVQVRRKAGATDSSRMFPPWILVEVAGMGGTGPGPGAGAAYA
jgi:hypothetical protein